VTCVQDYTRRINYVTSLKYTKYMNILQRVAGSEHAIETEMSEDGPS